MGFLISTLLTASAAFIATNIDDIFLLTLFFSQMNQNFCKRHIILGQYLGFALLVLLSALGFLVGLIIPKAWIGLLGILPIFMGVRQLLVKESQDTAEPKLETNPQIKGIWSSLISPQTYAVALVTFANGGDNISIYTPLFASQNLSGFFADTCRFRGFDSALAVSGVSLGKAQFNPQNYRELWRSHCSLCLDCFRNFHPDRE